MAKRHDDSPLSPQEIRSIVGQEITSAVGYVDGTISRERANALKYYRQEPYGNEQAGRSQVVTGDVQDTIEWTMPQLMRIFLSADKMVSFNPEGREDEEAAEAKTKYVHHVATRDNPAFEYMYDWFKDALLQKNGILKVYWSETDEQWQTSHSGLTEDEVVYMLEQDPDVEVLDRKIYESDEPAGVDEFGQELPGETLVDVTLEHTKTIKKVAIEGVPPEEFIISREARSMEHARMKGHRIRRTVSDLMELGFKRDQLISLSETGAFFGLHNTEFVTRRHQEYEYPRSGSAIDDSTREVVVVEAYMHLDIDGDGTAELVQVWVGGDSHVLLEYEDETRGTGGYAYEEFGDPLPFIDITPIRMPHVFFGRSMFDLVGDLQLIHSTILRQIFDNAYFMNNQRTAVWEGRVDLDDMLTNRVGGIVRTDGNPAEVMMPMPVQPIGQMMFPLLEYIEQQREGRSGVTRNAQGMDPATTTNDTAYGMMRLMAAAQQRVELIARLFAETGVKKLMMTILKLSIAHQDKAREIQVSGDWVEMDPRYWQVSFDMTAEVGLGYDSQEQELIAINSILQDQKEAIQFQGGAQGPLVTLENVHNALEVKTKAAGLRHPTRFFSDPQSEEMQALMQQMQSQEQPEDPALMLAQGQLQNEQARIQMEAEDRARKHELEVQKLQLDAQLKARELELKNDLEREKIAAQMDMKAAEIEATDEANIAKLDAQADLAREKAEFDMLNKEISAASTESG